MPSARESQLSIEARKARYSRELATYTLRQWNLVRQSMEGSTSSPDKSETPSTSQCGGSDSLSRDSSKIGRSQQGWYPSLCETANNNLILGIRAHDYARSPHKQMGGQPVAGSA
ncbi:hypothetical protein C8Q78DRAFT_1039439 [Trametes maxima]|nr:hypothetical protein C8Q78DRAFT_1039439 [Trametes maxima]